MAEQMKEHFNCTREELYINISDITLCISRNVFCCRVSQAMFFVFVRLKRCNIYRKLKVYFYFSFFIFYFFHLGCE
jgi:hypothetical protein